MARYKPFLKGIFIKQIKMLRGQKVLLRAIEPEDIELILSWENNVDNMRFGDCHLPYSRYAVKQYILSAGDEFFDVKQVRFIIESLVSKEAIGHLDVFDYHPTHKRAAVGILIDPQSNRRQGFAQEALSLLKPYAKDVLLLNQLYCHIAATNSLSMGLFKSVGFEESGVLKAWTLRSNGFEDEIIMQCLL